MSILENLISQKENPANKRIIEKKLRLLRAVFNKESISVNELMRELGLSFPTLNPILMDLVEEKFLIQTERGESLGGRKPNLYQLNQGIFKVICIEIAQFSIQLTLVDNNGNAIVQPQNFPIQLVNNKETLHDISARLDEFIEQHHISMDQVNGIAVAMPGLIDQENNLNYTFFHYEEENLVQTLENKWNKKVTIINDVKLMTYAEKTFGALKKVRDGLTIMMDWGLSMGIVANGSIYLGKNGFSGEMGHINFVEDGELCYCGKRGCLETVASGVALINRVKRDLSNHIPTLLAKEANSNYLFTEKIIEVALSGDQYAIEVITALGKNLGKAIALFVQIFNPEVVILTGKFAQAGKFITAPIEQQLQTYAMGRILKETDVILSNLQPHHITASLARYFIHQYFENQLNQSPL